MYSQAPAWAWALGASTANSEQVNKVAVDKASGSVYIVGSYAAALNPPYGATMAAVYGGTDAFLVKYNSAGTFQWSHRMGGTSNESATGVAVDNAGNVYVCGKFQTTANFYHNPASTPSYDLTSAGSDDIFIVKYNSSGTFQWAARGGGTGSDQALAIKADANGVYVTGSYNSVGATMASYSVASLSSIALTSAGGSTEMFLMKYSTAGVIQWALKGGSTLTDIGYDVAADASNVYVVGEYQNTFSVYNSSNVLQTTLTPSLATGDIFILSYSQAGAFNWATNIASSIADYGRGITCDATYLYVTGGVGTGASYKFPTPAFTTTSSANQDLFLAKLNISNGVFQFAQTENGAAAGIEVANSISYHSSGKVFIAGRHDRGINFTSQATTLTPSPLGTNDVFVANYTTNGNLIYAKGAGGTGADVAYGIDNDNNGDAYVGGDAAANCVFTPTTLTGGLLNNIFISKIGCGVVLTTPNAGSDQTVCATTATLAGNNPTTGSGTWSLQSGAGTITTPGAFNSGITGLGVGVNTFVWKISGSGCAALSDTVRITRDNFPTTSNAGVTMSLCGTTTVLAGNVPAVGTGTWSTFAGTSTITNVNLATSAVTVAVGSPFSTTSFSWSIKNGVCPVSTSTVSIISYTTTSPSNAGTTMSVCGTATTLAGNVPAAGTGTWSTFAGTSTITNVNLATSQVTVGGGSPSSTTNFSWTIQNGVCPATTSTVSIISYTPSTISNAGPTMSLCGTTTVLAGNVPVAGTGTWSTFAGTSTITNVNLATSQVTVGGGSPSSTTNFSWTIKNGVCPSSTSTVSIISYTTPTASNAGANQTVCAATATMNGNTPAVGTGTWSLVSGSGVPTSPNSPNSQITGLGVGINVFQWSIGNGVCSVSNSTMSIQRDQIPTTSNAGPNQTVCATTATLAGNTPAVGTGVWNVISGPGAVSAPSLPNSGVLALGLGSNVFEWVITNGVCPSSSSTVDVFVDTNPTTSNAGSSQSVCSTNATMAGNIPAVGTGSWTLISGSGIITSPTSPNTGITALGIGVNVFQWSISNGVCPPSTSTMSITRYINPTASNAGSNQTVCATVATLAGNTPAIGTGSWSLVSGAGTITTPTLPASGITALGLGINVFQWTITNGVCPSSSSTMSVQRDDNPTTSVAGPNQSVCATTATMAGNTPAVGTGSWTLVSGSGLITSPTSPNTGITALGLGVNVFMWTISNGVCPNSTSTMSIQRDAIPTTAVAGPNQTVCASTATMAGNTPAIGTGSWTLLSGSALITTPTSPNTGLTAIALGSNIFEWSITNGVCPASTSTVEIYRDNSPSLSNAGPNQTVCATTATLNANTPAIGTGSWTLISGSGVITSPTLPNSGITALGIGVNVFQWTVIYSTCPPSISTVAIQRDANPTISNAGPTQSLCATSATTMAGNTAIIGTGLWTLISGAGTITTPTLETTNITALGTGTNIFQWTISNGVCPASSSTVALINYGTPTSANAGPNQTVCATIATLAGNTPAVGTGSWTLISGSGTITNPTLATTGLTSLGVGVNVFQWEISNGVCASSISTVSIQRDASPGIAVAGPNQTVCSTTATMAATSPTAGSGAWTLVSGSAVITTPASAISAITSLGAGVNVFQWTISNGVCPSSSATMSIQRDLNPTVANAGPNQSVCATTATLAGNTIAIGVGVWNVLVGSAAVSAPTSPNSSVIGLSVGSNVFEWYVTNGVCPASSSTVEVWRDLPPTTSVAGPSIQVCGSATTMAANSPVIGTGLWTLVSGSGIITTPNSPTSGLTAVGVGTNVFQWTISNGSCPPSTSTVAVVRYIPPTVSNAGPNQTVCATTANMAGNTPIFGTGIWTLISGTGVVTTPTLPTTGITGLGVGVNVFQWTISNGNCTASSSTMSIQRDQNPTPSNAGSNQSVCATSAVMNANTPAVGTGTWTLISGSGIITSVNSPNTTITSLGIGVNVFQWTIGNGVCPNSSSTVSIQRDAVPSIASAGPNQTVCATFATMAGNTPTTGVGLWTLVSGVGTITSPNAPNTGLTALGVGVNVFQWTISNGVCPSSSSTVSIQRDQNPTASAAGSNQTVCATVATLAGNTPAVGTGSWTLISGSAVITSPTSPNSGVTALGVGINVFQWTISNGVCPSSSSTVSIQRDAVPSIANAGPSQTFCATSSFTMAGNTPTAGTGLWTLVSGAGTITTPTLPTTGISGIGNGTNVFMWTISNGVCPSTSSTMSILNYAMPTTANAGPNQSICATSTLLAGNTPVIGTGVWNVIVGPGILFAPTAPNSSVVALQYGTNQFEWTITNGICPVSTSTVTITAYQNPTTANAGISQTICATTATLAGNTPAVGTGSWTLVSGSALITTPTVPNTGLTAVAIGTNILQWTTSNGVCPISTSTVSVQNDANPTTAVAGPNQSVCANSATLAGNTPAIGSGSWTLVQGAGTILTPTAPNSVLTALGTSTSVLNIFMWTISNGVCPPSTSTVGIDADAVPTTANAGPNQTICATTATLAGNTPAIGTGSWTLISGSAVITTPTLETSGITAVAVGTNVLMWTISNGVCPPSTSTVAIIRDPFPTTSIAGPTQSVCASSATMAGNVPAIGTGSWTLVSGAGTIANPTLATTPLTALGTGTNIFMWSISNGVCPPSTSTVMIEADAVPTTANAGPSQTLCATTTTLAGNVPAIGTGSWTLISGFASITTPTLPNTQITAAATGTNILQWTISNGVCPASTATVAIYNLPNPSPSNAGADQTICSGNATMAANVPAIGTGSWSLVSGVASITTPTLATTGLTGVAVGTNVLMWTISNGVCPNTTSTVAIVRDPNPTVANAGSNQTICIGNATLAGNTPAIGTGSWTLISGSAVITTPTLETTGITAVAVGTNILQWTITNGVCPPSISTVAIIRDPAPTVASATPDQTICAGNTVLSGNAPTVGTGLWTLVSGAATITTPTLNTSGVTGVAVGTNVLMWTISNGVCPSSSATMSIVRDPVPTTANAGPTQTICQSTATLAGNTPAVGTGSWTLLSGSAVITTPTLETSGLTSVAVGTNILQWTITNGVCPPSVSTVAIIRDPVPTVASATPNQTICAGNTTLNGNVPTIGSGLWTLVAGVATITTPTLNNSGVTGVAVGTSILKWTISNGVCPSSSATMSIVRDPVPTTANAGPTQTICQGTATLAGNTPAVGTGSWTLISGSAVITTPTLETSGLTSVAVGTNILQWTITNGVCPPSISTVAIIRDPVPTIAVAGPNQTICPSTTVLAGNAPTIGTGLWTVISGVATITTPTLNTSGVTAIGIGTNILQWTISNGVCPSSSATMSIQRDALPTTAVAGPNQTICATATVLAANAPAIGTGSWTLISGSAAFTTPTLNTSNVTAIATGTNILQWTISNGVCPASSATMSIQNDPNPSISVAGPNQTICPSATVLAGNAPAIGTGSWTLISGAATITTPTLNSSNVTAVAIGTNILQWTISNGVCPSSSSTMSIQRDALPTTALAGPNQTICATATVLAGNTPAIGTGNWSLISGGLTITTPTFEASNVTGISGGVNVLQWTISNGVCPSSSATMSIQRDLNPTTATVSANQTVCATTATISGSTPAIGTGLWTLVSGGAAITTPNTPTTGLTALSGGVNVFQWTISNGVCPSSSATTSVQRDLPSSISVAGPNQTVCATTAIMAGNTPAIGTGTWSLISGGAAITTPTSPNTGITTLSVGINVFDWTIKNGVCPSSTSTMSIQRDDNPTPSAAGPSQSVCGTSAVFAANTPTVGTGLWSLVSGTGNILTPTAPNSAVSSLGIGVDVFQWTISNGVCPSSSSTMAITAYTNPATSVAGPNQTICATATVLAANTPSVGSGLWSLVSGAGIVATPSSPNSAVTGLGVGVNVFQWTISNGVCAPSTSTMSIQRDDNPTVANAGPNQTLCVSYTNLNATPLTVGTGSWTLIAGTGSIINPTLATSSYTGLAIGANFLQWTTSNGVCPSTTSTVEIDGIANVAPVNAGPDILFCGLTPTLAGLTPTVGTGTWIPVSAAPPVNSPNNPTSSVNFGGYGTYSYIWLVGYAGCPNISDTVNVTLFNLPTPASVAADQTICVSGSTISANTPTIGSGVWSVSAGTGTVSLPTSTISPVIGLSIGANSFVWTISNGVCPPSSATLNIQVDDNPSTPVAGVDQTICVTSNATLNATIPAIGTGTWSVVSGPSSVTSPTNNNSTATALNVGINSYQWIVSNGVCPTKADTVNVFVDDLPSAAIAGVDQFTCSMNTFMAGNIPAIGNGTWSPVGSAPQVNTPTSYSSSVNFTNQGVYSYVWTIGNGVCPNTTDIVTINTFLNPSDPDAGADQVICAMNTTLTANTISIGTGSWIPVNPLSSVSNSLVNITNATLPNQGVFGFVWQASNSAYCPAKNDTVYIRTYSNPSAANAGLDINGNCLLNSLAAITPSIGTGNWKIISGTGVFEDPSNPNTNYTSDVDGVTKLVWTVSNGVCPTSSDTMDIIIDAMLIPQIITPNSDGNNDVFEIKAFRCLTGVKINVFNRWGNLVYESGDYQNDFNGLNMHGEKLVDDTYYYVLEVGKKAYKGYVVIKTD